MKEFKTVFKTPGESPGFLLWQVSTQWRKSIENVLKPLQLTHPQFVVLATTGWLTKEGKQVTQSAIGKMARMDPNTLSQIMRTLQTKKLIERPQFDERSKSPLLTTQGQELLNKALSLVEQADSEFFAVVGGAKKEMLQLLQLLAKKKNIDQ